MDDSTQRCIGMLEDVVKEETDILTFLSTVKNEAKLKKLANRVYFESDSEIKKRVCMEMLKTPKPSVYVKQALIRIKEYSCIIDELIEQNAQGMVIVGNTIYPVKLITKESWLTEEIPWVSEDEDEIQVNAVDAWIRDNGERYFLGKVVLFKKFGFSGIPRMLEVRVSDV